MTGAAVVPLLAILASASDAAPFAVTPPATVIALDEGALHGAPIQLAWSPDSDRWYIETFEGEGASTRHHRFEVAVGDRAPKPIDAVPDWAVSYWNFKSNRLVPAHPTIMIAVDEAKRTGTMIGTQSGQQRARGAMSGNGGGDAGTALRGAQDANNDFVNAARVLTLTIDGRMISQLVDEPLIPGLTFGWSPKEYDAVAFRNEHHHGLSIYRIGGGTLDVPDTKEILLPAWSPDGKKIVFLERTGKKKYELRQVTVSLP